MMNATVELCGGRTLPLESLINQVPSTAFLGETFVEVCELLAQDEFQGDERKVYVNTISKKSRKARAIAAMIVLMRHGRLDAVKVSSDFIDARFSKLLGEQVEIDFHASSDRNLLRRFEILRFLGKAIYHRCFRLASLCLPKHRTEVMIRAWVDTTDTTFPDVVDSYPLVVFPFAGPIHRQFKYIVSCTRRGRKLRLSGVPYRFRDLVCVALDWKTGIDGLRWRN